jgi:N-acetylglucosamine-6-phosphate deacetylase
MGTDFSSQTLDKTEFRKAAREILNVGTCAFLPTVITSAREVYEKNLAIIAEVMREKEFEGRISGIHLEGPFISREPGAVGAHNPEWVSEPHCEYLKDMMKWSGNSIKLLTIAAETKGAEKLCSFAVENGITVSLGHQLALANDMAELASAGASALTHLTNGLPNMLHRHKNTIWSALAEDRLAAMIITDGHHVPAELIKIIIRAKGIENTVVVSDASPATGFPPGKYTVMGNNAILEPNGLLHNPEKGCMVGSAATIMDCANYLASLDFVSGDDIYKMALENPLRLIGVDKDSIVPCDNAYWNTETGRYEAC